MITDRAFIRRSGYANWMEVSVGIPDPDNIAAEGSAGRGCPNALSARTDDTDLVARRSLVVVVVRNMLVVAHRNILAVEPPREVHQAR
jgi:hypothetical protein